MRKFYTMLAAALFAATSFAQPLKRNLPTQGTISSPLHYKATVAPGTFQKTNLQLPEAKSGKLMMRHAPNLSVDPETKIINAQPAGTLYKNYYGINAGHMVFWGDVISTTIDGHACDFVVADDGAVYIKDAMQTLISGNWIKGQKAEGDTVVFTFPQKYYMEPGMDDEGNETTDSTTYYLWRMKINDAGNSMVVDSASQQIRYVLRNDSLIRIDNFRDGIVLGLATDEGEWVGYDDFASEWGKETATTAAPPASATIEDYEMAFGSEENGDNDRRVVRVAFDGNDFYLGKISDNEPEAWAKGQIEGDKVVFNGKVYMGVDSKTGYHTYFTGMGKKKVYYPEYDFTADSLYFVDQLVFNYDRDTKTLVSESNGVVNAGKNTTYALNEYDTPTLKPWKEVAGAPKDPEITDFMPYMDDYGYGAMQIYMEKESTDGNLLNPDKLFYNIYFDGELFTFYPDEYKGIKDEMTDVPMDFTDNNDFMVSGQMHTVYFFLQGITSVGVQEVYKDGDKAYKSNLMSYTVNEDGTLTGIDRNIVNKGEANVKSVSYTDLSGRTISQPQHGIYLKTVKFADGSQKTVKYLKR